MDIVLNTIFNNPNLPKIPIYGFSDDFNRPAADTLGLTAEGKSWVVRDGGSSTSVWGTTGSGTAKMKSATTSTHTAVVDAGVANGRLVAKLKNFNTALSSNRYGLAFRAQSMTSYFYIESTYPSATQLIVRKTFGGSSVTLGTTGVSPTAGDEIAVVLDGPSITIEINGVPKLTVTDADLVAETRHGMFAFAGADAEWDSIKFIPA